MKRRNPILWGLLYAVGYSAGAAGIGIAAAPCTGSCAAIVGSVDAAGDGPPIFFLAFFGTIAAIGALNGVNAARRYNAERGL